MDVWALEEGELKYLSYTPLKSLLSGSYVACALLMREMSRKKQPAGNFISIEIFFGKLRLGALRTFQLLLRVNCFLPAEHEGDLRKRNGTKCNDEECKTGLHVANEYANPDDEQVEGIDHKYRSPVPQPEVHQFVMKMEPSFAFLI